MIYLMFRPTFIKNVRRIGRGGDYDYDHDDDDNKSDTGVDEEDIM